MKTFALLLLSLVGCSTPQIGDLVAVQFDELVQNPERFVGKTVHLQCTMTLFGERTIFTASGMTPSFDCGVIYLRARGDWEKSARFVALRGEVRQVLEHFRKEHPNLRWPEVEARVDLIAKFDWPDQVANFTFAPIEVLDIRLWRILALAEDPLSRTLLTFPVGANEKGPNQMPLPTPAVVTPVAKALVAPPSGAAGR